MSIVGHNLYINGVRHNSTLIPVGAQYQVSGLASDVDFAVTATNVDQAGNESDPSAVFPFSTLGTPPTTNLTDEQKSAIDAIVAASMATSKAPGVVLDITGPAGSYAKGYGTTHDGSRPVSTDDHFRIGSVTKMFVAYAAFQQIDAGTLRLTDKLSDYLTGFTNGDLITIAHIMSMRSGVTEFMADFFGWQLWTFLFPTQNYTDAQALAGAKGSQFPPDSKYAYTNSNAIIMGEILKVITGRDIRQILKEDVIDPLGLVETQWPTGSSVPSPFMANHQFQPNRVGAAGSLTSSIRDQTRFAKALRDGELLSPAAHELWMNTFPTIEPLGDLSSDPASVGYGYFMMSYGQWLGHGGSTPGGPGFSTACLYHPDSGATINVAANKQTAGAEEFYVIARQVGDLLYPGSMVERDFNDKTIKPSAAVVSVTGGVPRIVIDTPNKLIQPATASVTVTGGTPGASALTPAAASVTVTGGTPTVTVAAPEFTPFTEENLARIDREVPAGAAGCWVTLVGAGGGGGSGRSTDSDATRPGGGGGGGGGKIPRVFIAATELGSTYSVTRGLGGAGGAAVAGTGASNGNAGAAGGLSRFTSGSVTLTANGGGGGAPGLSSGSAAGGTAGTASALGITATTINGSAGGSGSTNGGAGAAAANNTAGAGAGGGGGGGITSGGTKNAGGGGGNSTSTTGGLGGVASGAIGNAPGGTPTDQTAGAPGAGGGGAGHWSANTGQAPGGPGGDFGGGGGGGSGGTRTITRHPGGNGGDGYTMIEWV